MNDKRKTIFACMAAVLCAWLGVIAWQVTGYLMDVRYEKQVTRTQIEQIEKARVEAEVKHKEWLAGAKARAEQAKIEAERSKVEWESEKKRRLAEYETRSQQRELESKERSAKVAAAEKEFWANELAKEDARKAAFRQAVEENEAKRRASKQ